MGILDSLPGIVAGAAGQALFSDLTLIRVQKNAPDGRGGFNEVKTNYAARGIVTEYSEFKRLIGNLPHDARQCIIQAQGLAISPRRDDLVDFDGICWKILEVSSPPGQPIFECMVEETNLSTGAGDILAQINAGLSISLDSIGQSLSGNIVDPNVPRNGSLVQALEPLLQNLSGNVVVPRTGSLSQTLGAIATSATGDADVSGILAQQLLAIESNVSGNIPITGNLSQTLEPVTIQAGASQSINAVLSQQLETIVANASGDVDITALGGGVLAPITTNASGDVDVAGGLAQQLQAIQNNLSGDVDIYGSAAQTLDPISTSIAADADINGSLSQGLGNVTITASGTVVDAGPNLGEPTLAAGVQYAFDPKGTTGGSYTTGIAPHSQAPQQVPLWPVNGADDTVRADWNGILNKSSGQGANALVIDNSDLAAINVQQQARTYSFWAKFEDVGNGNHYREFFGQGANWPGGSSVTGDHGLRVDGPYVRYSFDGSFNGQTNVITGVDNFIDDTWHHYVISLAYGDFDFYVDGVRAGGYGYTGTDWELPASAYAMVWAVNDALGGEVDHTGDFSNAGSFNIEIGDIRLYDEKLNDAAALALFNDGRYEYDAGVFTPSSGLEPETDAIIAQYTGTPPAGRDSDMDTLVSALKAGGVWSKLHWLSVINFDDQASELNLITPTESLSKVGTPAVVADQYFDAVGGGNNGWAGYADASVKGASAGNFSIGGYWLKLDEVGVTRNIRTGDNNTFFRSDFSAPQGKINNVTVNTTATRLVNDPQFVLMVNDALGATGAKLYHKGVEVGTSDATSAVQSTGDVEFGSHNTAADCHYGAFVQGLALTAAEVTTLNDALTTYLTAIGAIAAPAPSLVQEVSNQSDANPITLTWGATPTEGNLLVVVAGARQSDGDNTITGTGWTQHFIENTYQADSSNRRLLTVWTKVAGASEPGTVTVDFGSSATEALLMEIDVNGLTPTFGAVDIDNGGTAPANLTASRTGLTAGNRIMLACGVIRSAVSDLSAADFDGDYAGQNIDTYDTDQDCWVGAAWHYKTDTADETVTLSNPPLAERGAMALLDFTLT